MIRLINNISRNFLTKSSIEITGFTCVFNKSYEDFDSYMLVANMSADSINPLKAPCIISDTGGTGRPAVRRA